MSVQPTLADFNLRRSRPPPVADAGRRRGSKVTSKREGVQARPVCDYTLLRMVVGSSPTRRAKENTADKSLLCFFVFIKGWT